MKRMEALRPMINHFKRDKPERSAEVFVALGDYMTAARLFEETADDRLKDGNYIDARRFYSLASRSYREAGDKDRADTMRSYVFQCGEMQQREQQGGLVGEIRNEIRHLRFTLREIFVRSTGALLQGMKVLGASQRQAALESAEIVFRGLERLAASNSEALGGLTAAVREGNLVKLFSVLSSLEGLDGSEISASLRLKDTFKSRLATLEASERPKFLCDAISMLDTVYEIAAPKDEPESRPLLDSFLETATQNESRLIQRDLEDLDAIGRELVQVHECLLEGGPGDIVEEIRDQRGLHSRCKLAHSVMTLQWHGVGSLGSEQMKEGGCPLPNFLGSIQKHRWTDSFPLADGRDHSMAVKAAE